MTIAEKWEEWAAINRLRYGSIVTDALQEAFYAGVKAQATLSSSTAPAGPQKEK